MTHAEYPIAEVQGLYRTIAELRQQVASADLYRADAMELMQQQDQTIDALKARISELTATLTAVVRQRRRGDLMRETNSTEIVVPYGSDPVAANCRAITMCAAEIGRRMKEAK